MTSEELIKEFQRSAAADGSFHHAEHVRLAFECLRRLPILKALETFPAALKQFAIDRGRPKLYHATITWAHMLLIQERIARSGVSTEEQSWQQFAENNPDLLLWKDGILSRFYDEATLKSELARTIFVFPDRLQSDSGRGLS
jgi:hypothetical protein